MWGKAKQCGVLDVRLEKGFYILNLWLQIKQRGQGLQPYFYDNMLRSIAIYGMGALGERLYDELRNSGVSISYGIDRIANLKKVPGLKIIDANTTGMPQVDAIVVTPVQDYWKIVGLLENRTEAAIVTLADIVEYCALGE